MINRVWKREEIPSDWNKDLICPIYKRGEKRKIKNYRGITLMEIRIQKEKSNDECGLHGKLRG